jgi:hypothetical protein
LNGFSKAWELGLADAEKRRPIDDRANRFRRGIGKIRTAPLEEETVSWLYCVLPEWDAYVAGHTTRSKYLSAEESARLKDLAMPRQDYQMNKLAFFGWVSIWPSFGGAYGKIDRYADPRDLSDVRVVMKVGENIYQPDAHPGDIQKSSGSSLSSLAIPTYDTTTSRTTASGTAVGPGGAATVSGSSKTTTTTAYIVHRNEEYNWYQGAFAVDFALFNADGTPRILPHHKDIEIIVLYGPNERKAKFSLADLKAGYR